MLWPVTGQGLANVYSNTDKGKPLLDMMNCLFVAVGLSEAALDKEGIEFHCYK